MSLQQSLTLTNAWDPTVDTASVVAYLATRAHENETPPDNRTRRRAWQDLRRLTTGMSACVLAAQL